MDIDNIDVIARQNAGSLYNRPQNSNNNWICTLCDVTDVYNYLIINDLILLDKQCMHAQLSILLTTCSTAPIMCIPNDTF